MRASFAIISALAAVTAAAPAKSIAQESIPIGSGGYFDVIQDGETNGCLNVNGRWQISPCNVVTYSTVEADGGFTVWPVTGGGDQFLGVSPGGGDWDEGELGFLLGPHNPQVWTSEGLFLLSFADSTNWYVAADTVPQTGADEATLYELEDQTGSSDVVTLQLKWHASE